MKQKYLFLYIPAWWGHVSTANAVAIYFHQHYAEQADVEVIDGFQDANRLLKKIIIDGYKKSQTTGQRIYEFLYRCNKRRPIAKTNQVLLSWFLKSDMKKLLLQHKPTHVVILHFFLVRPMVKAIKELWLDIPITTIITDPFTIHKLRSLDKKMNYVVFSDRAKNAILERGVAEKNIHLTPVVLKEEFSKPLSEERIIELKKKFGLALDKKIILMLWWGDGLPKGAKTLQRLIDHNVDAQILVVCGRSDSFFRQVTKIQKQHPEVTIKAFHGFIDFIYDVVNVSDIIVTKWWPATLMEILMMNKIPLINSYIREQEKWNIQFVVDNKLGVYETDVAKMVEIVKQMLASEEYMSEYYRNIKNMQLKNGTQEVAEHLIKK